MNVDNLNVVSLFKTMEKIEATMDPISELVQEMGQEEVIESKKTVTKNLVTENHFPDQSMYILDEQLKSLKQRLNRMKFYMGELDDLLPN